MYDVIFYHLLVGLFLLVDAIFLDINCRYAPHVKIHVPELACHLPLMLVGWLHANAGHNLQCQLKYCGMYQDLLGRCIGEQCEQLWVSSAVCDVPVW